MEGFTDVCFVCLQQNLHPNIVIGKHGLIEKSTLLQIFLGRRAGNKIRKLMKTK